MKRNQRRQEKAKRRAHRQEKGVTGRAGAQGAQRSPNAPAGEERPRVYTVMRRDGRAVHDPAQYLSQIPRRTLSDSLLALMEPYICWPPPQGNGLEELSTWLLVGAAVWNTTLSGMGRTMGERDLPGRLDGLRMYNTLDVPQLTALTAEIVERKKRMFSNDNRIVARVDVVHQGDRAEVLTMSLAWVS